MAKTKVQHNFSPKQTTKNIQNLHKAQSQIMIK